MYEVVGSGAFAILCVFIGAYISWKGSASDKKLNNTFDLHREFMSSSMLESRAEADRFLYDHKGKNFRELYKTVDQSRMAHVWNVLMFYQRLEIAARLNQLNSKAAAEIFGEAFVYWYIIFLREGLAGTNWSTEKKMEHFFKWLERMTPPQQFKEWKQWAVSEYEAMKK